MAKSSTKQFDTILKQVLKSIKQNNLEAAAKEYAELKKEYSAILQSEASPAQKKAAYKKVANTYNLIVKAKQKAPDQAKKEVKKEESILVSEAIRDLEKQITQLTGERNRLESQLHTVKNQMAQVQNEETKLRDKISALVEDEAKLNTKRLHIVESITQVKDKMADIAKIKEQLRIM